MPRNPGAWLMTTAKHRQIDLARRAAVFRAKREEVARETPLVGELELGEPIEDDMLRLFFTTCHPALSRESQVALTLRLFGGLTTPEIARALLSDEKTIGTRISRAKRSLRDAGSPFEVPADDELAGRLSAVLGVIYLIYNEGYAASSGDAWMRIDLCEEALRLARVAQGLLPDQAEVHGLAALLEIQSSRARARVGAAGEAITLVEQDRGRWDRLLIERGLAALDRALRAGGAKGIYTLQAQIAACHARAADFEATDWREIAQLYSVLAELAPSAVVEINRAVAASYADGPQAGLSILAAVEDGSELARGHLFHAVRGDLLERAGDRAGAAAEFARAAELCENRREREVFERRLAAASA